MSKWINKWRKLSSSLAFKLSMYYSISTLFIILFVLSFIYLQVMGALYGDNFRQVSSTAKRLITTYETEGRVGLIAYINQELTAYTPNSRELLYMENQQGEKVVGNLDSVPSDLLTGDYLTEVGAYQNSRYIDARLRKLELGSDLIYVGRNIEGLVRIRGLMGRISVMTIVLALLLSGLCTYWFLFELRAGASSIRKTAEQIRAGRFKQRIPVSDQEDEITLLSQELNLMLDHMESSLNGVRYVTDTIAHNLRTPLLRILAILRPLKKTDLSVSDAKKGVNQALIELESLRLLFDKLLQISEIESGLQRQAVKKVHLNLLLFTLLDLYEVIAEDKEVKLQVKTQQECFILADEDLVASALSNILENALKYTTDQIIVRLYTIKTWVCIEVQDNGLGVELSSLDYLGQHFYRDIRAASLPGTGLGLSSVLAVMKLHQGHCTFENMNPGFKVVLWFPILLDGA